MVCYHLVHVDSLFEHQLSLLSFDVKVHLFAVVASVLGPIQTAMLLLQLFELLFNSLSLGLSFLLSLLFSLLALSFGLLLCHVLLLLFLPLLSLDFRLSLARS